MLLHKRILNLSLFIVLSQCEIIFGALLRISKNSGLSSPKCGIAIFQDRIVGGNETNINDYPWTALFHYHHAQKKIDTFGCGGAYIGGRTILSAAHCVDEQSRHDLGELKAVRLGEYDTETDPDCIQEEDFRDCADPPIDFGIESILIHPKRSSESKEYDIAIIIIDAKPPYTDFIRPICLPDISENFNKDDFGSNVLYTAGWGWTVGHIRSPSNVKRHVNIEYVHHDVCRKQYEKITLNPNSQLCAGGKYGRNPCRGDSGGPLMKYVRATYWQLIGLVSFGPSICAIDSIDGKAAVFTKIQYFIPWIVQNAL